MKQQTQIQQTKIQQIDSHKTKTVIHAKTMMPKKTLIIRYAMILLLLAMIPLLSIRYAYAFQDSGHISLLTVAESGNVTTEHGGVADLYLTIKKGTGRIFIDSFPLSKIDTQITMRFAAEMACDFLDKDCSQYDFFYTIRANSAIVGGPSAGAAATVLTVAMLDDQHLDERTVMTGTIDSGNLVGPVAGISAKTQAAQDFGFTKVLIPKWEVANETPSPGLMIRVVPIATLEDALFEFTGKNYTTGNGAVASSDNYNNVMKQVAVELCAKYGSFKNGVLLMPNLSMIFNSTGSIANGITSISNATGNAAYNSASNASGNASTSDNASANASSGLDVFDRAAAAINAGEYYSAASFCFSGNVRVASENERHLNSTMLKTQYAILLGNISTLQQQLEDREKNFKSVSELESYVVVKERLSEAQDILKSEDPDNISYIDMAYANERFTTAIIWSRFFDLPGANFVMDNESLRAVCISKLSEVEERINYLETYLPKPVSRDTLNQAYDYYNTGEYAMCIFTASKAKADVDVVSGALFVDEKNIKNLLTEKISAAGKAIAKQEKHGVFPILGYSYYEYAKTLSGTDMYSALIYSEYALELSNIDMYFPKAQSTSGLLDNISIDWSSAGILLVGIAVGIILSVIIAALLSRRHSRRRADDPKVRPQKNSRGAIAKNPRSRR